MNKKKILFFTHDTSLFGATRSLLDMQQGLTNSGEFECKVILPYGGPMESILKETNTPYEVIPYAWTTGMQGVPGTPWDRLKRNIRQYFRFRRLYKSFHPDIAYFNTSTIYFPLFYFSLWKVKTIFHLREYGYEDYKLTQDWSGRLFKKALKNASMVLTNSLALSAFYNKKYQVVSTVLYNGIAPEEEFYRRKQIYKKKYPADVITLAMVGSINENKGSVFVFEVFIELVKKYNIQLEYYGSGPQENVLKERVTKEGLNNKVFFKGFVNEPDTIYKNMDLLIMASKYEAFGRVTAEAMSYGVPVLGLDAGGTSELLEDGNGVLFDGSKEDFIDKLSNLIENDSVRSEIAEKAWTYALVNFSREKYVNRFISLLND